MKYDRILLKPNRKVIRENLPKNNLRPPYITLTKIHRSWFVCARKHYDKHGNHNGFLIPYTSQDFTQEWAFVWTEWLKHRGLTIAK